MQNANAVKSFSAAVQKIDNVLVQVYANAVPKQKQKIKKKPNPLHF